jgi:hypothetical protein
MASRDHRTFFRFLTAHPLIYTFCILKLMPCLCVGNDGWFPHPNVHSELLGKTATSIAYSIQYSISTEASHLVVYIFGNLGERCSKKSF